MGSEAGTHFFSQRMIFHANPLPHTNIQGQMMTSYRFSSGEGRLNSENTHVIKMKEKPSFLRSHSFWIWMPALLKLQCKGGKNCVPLIKATELLLSGSHVLPRIYSLGRSCLAVRTAWKLRDFIRSFGKFSVVIRARGNICIWLYYHCSVCDANRRRWWASGN